MSFRFNVDSQSHESLNPGSATYCLGDVASIIDGSIISSGALYYTIYRRHSLEPDIQVVSIYPSQCQKNPNILSIFLLPY